MNSNKQKLELTWIGKGEEPRLEPRILIEDPGKSYGDSTTGNMLIHGDNLLALKALEQDFTDKITCVYIDPPYNTGSAFEHYDDNLEHSVWLNLMRPRLELLKKLLHPTKGSIWISIDDDESHYLKVLCDEVFGRSNFVASVIWQKKHTRANDAKWFSDNHDYVLVYAKNKLNWKRNLLPRPEEEGGYSNPDNDTRGPWASQPMQVKTPSDKCIYEITGPTGKKFWPPKSRSWQFGMDRYKELVADNRIWFGEDGSNVPRIKKFLSEVKQGFVPLTIWPREEVGDNQEAKDEMKTLFSEDPFGTPKPERLISRIVDLATQPNDWILDSFLGSGTTSAVAHKKRRKHIGIEFGEHASTHCQPRLKKVIDGKDGLALSKVLGWNGGGGFKFYDLAPSLLRQDKFGNWVIEAKYNAHMLAAAMAKQEGFHFEPDSEVFWKQAKSTEKDFLFTTTQFLTLEMLDSIHSEMQPEESLLIACKAYYESCDGKYSNITIKKIPQILLGRCEYGKDDYSLNIINVPIENVVSGPVEKSIATKPKEGKKKKV